MFDKEKKETIQDIAFKLVEEQLRTARTQSGPKQRTVFVLGSGGVGKTTVINRFLGREELNRPTTALEYSFGRRSTPSQVVNIWELGSLQNTEELFKVPFRAHGLDDFAAVIILDLSKPQYLWFELDKIFTAFKAICKEKLTSNEATPNYAFERIKKEHIDFDSLDLLPIKVVIVGGKYDVFKDFDPTLKNHICQCIRSVAHLNGCSVLFHSNQISKLSKTLRDTISHLSFGSPSNPFRSHNTDCNDALSIWFGTDTWERISSNGPLSMSQIGKILSAEMAQAQYEQRHTSTNPANDPGFSESIIDEMRAQKDEELRTMVKAVELHGKFERINT